MAGARAGWAQQKQPEGPGCGREMTGHHPGGREVPGEAAGPPGASGPSGRGAGTAGRGTSEAPRGRRPAAGAEDEGGHAAGVSDSAPLTATPASRPGMQGAAVSGNRGRGVGGGRQRRQSSPRATLNPGETHMEKQGTGLRIRPQHRVQSAGTTLSCSVPSQGTTTNKDLQPCPSRQRARPRTPTTLPPAHRFLSKKSGCSQSSWNLITRTPGAKSTGSAADSLAFEFQFYQPRDRTGSLPKPRFLSCKLETAIRPSVLLAGSEGPIRKGAPGDVLQSLLPRAFPLRERGPDGRPPHSTDSLRTL
ncbi:uncharacterized protein [Physeter macrocephalus]|uniref:Collagen alpha-1(I) chain-like n=1 Tax=Physeter macrocephalus TaxID=9755 RepID=A0A455B5G7_PHYMC|nr:uncharacterized protein LOC114486081 [Physeter catodon]XP_054939963.1 uncharacterized protein LOC114486081 [Physeter catodon]|eukprot:XP_028344037.1 uncharacterized protein LOC114486081 [Physeter catodon]